MAYGILPKPGTEFGACEGECNHKDCQATREQANHICPICGEKIGYENKFSIKKDSTFVHYICLIEEH